MAINKQSFYQLSVFTLFGFGLIAWLIIEFVHAQPASAVFWGEEPWFLQLLYGSVFGLVASALAVLMVSLPFFKKSLHTFINLAHKLQLTYQDIVFFSLCAAIGEELLFRGAIQYYLGIWPTAVLFVALHGYLNPYNWRLSVYGVFMVLVAAGFGYLYEYVGIYAAIAAHFIIDVLLFSHLKREAERLS